MDWDLRVGSCSNWLRHRIGLCVLFTRVFLNRIVVDLGLLNLFLGLSADRLRERRRIV